MTGLDLTDIFNESSKEDLQKATEDIKQDSLNLADLVTETESKDKQNNEDFLKERGFDEYFENANEGIKEQFVKTVKDTEYQLKSKISLNAIITAEIKGIVRSNNAKAEIIKLLNYIEKENQELLTNMDKINIETPSGKKIDYTKKITFNQKMLGKFKQTIVAFDTEANKVSESVLNSAVNYQAKRVIINIREDYKPETQENFSIYSTNPNQVNIQRYITENGLNPEETEYDYCILCKKKIDDNPGLICDDCHEMITKESDKNWSIIFLYSKNLFDCNLLADFETLLACVFSSALKEGHEDLLGLYKQVQKYKIPISINLLEELLFEKRKSIWIAHNAKYDINKLNALYKPSRSVREPFTILNDYETEFIDINSTRQEKYSIKLGNTHAGFRFYSDISTRYNPLGLPQIQVSPIQHNSFSFVNTADTMILGIAGQLDKNAKLSTLSKGLEYEKVDLDEEKNYTLSDFELDEEGRISDKLHYNIVDSLSTIAVFSKELRHFDVTELENVLDIKTNSEKKYVPLISKLTSPASMTKIILTAFLVKETGLTEKEIMSNLEKQREYFNNFEMVYTGAATDSEVARLVTSDLELTLKEIDQALLKYQKDGLLDEVLYTKQLLAYLDFRSQYPHASWLSKAITKLLLASKNELQNYTSHNINRIQTDFWKFVNDRIKNPLKPLEREFFLKLDGTCTVETLVNDLEFRGSLEGRRTDVFVPKHSIKTCSIIELAYAVIQYRLTHTDNKHKKIFKFIKAERFELDDFPLAEHGEEFYTLIYNLRIHFEKILGKHASLPQLLKLIINAAYGIHAEGSSKDYLGRFLNYAVAAPVTDLSRFCTKYAKLIYRSVLKVLPCYNDTDSVIALATFYQHELVRNLFRNTIQLDYEKDLAYRTGTSINYQMIIAGYFLGKKRYGLKYLDIGIIGDFESSNPNFDFDISFLDVLYKKAKTEYYAKKSGIGQHAYTKKEISKEFSKLYGIVIEHELEHLGSHVSWKRELQQKIIEQMLPEWKYWSQLTYSKDKDSRVRSIKKILSYEDMIDTYNFHDILDLHTFHLPAIEKYKCNSCKQETELINVKVIKRKSGLVQAGLLGSAVSQTKTVSKCCKAKTTKKVEKELYLITNLEKLQNMTKGSFGDYFKLENVIFFISADIKGKFRELAPEMFAHLREENKLPTLIKPIVYNNAEREKLSHLKVLEYLFQSDQDDFDEYLMQYNNNWRRMKYLVDVMKYYRLRPNDEYVADELLLRLQEDISANGIRELLGLLEFFEEKKILKGHLTEKLNAEIIRNSLIESEKSEYEMLIEEAPFVRNKLMNLIAFDISHYSRELVSVPNKPYDIMIPNKVYQKVCNKCKAKNIFIRQADKQKCYNKITVDKKEKKCNNDLHSFDPTPVIDEQIILKTNFDQTFNIDGWNIKGTCILPRLEFTSPLVSYQTSYYSQAIKNFAYIFSKCYIEQRYKNKNLQQEQLNRLLDKDKKEYPIGQERNEIVVPFKIKQYWSTVDLEQAIPENELLMSLNEEEIISFCNSYSETENQYAKQILYDKFDAETIEYNNVNTTERRREEILKKVLTSEEEINFYDRKYKITTIYSIKERDKPNGFGKYIIGKKSVIRETSVLTYNKETKTYFVKEPEEFITKMDKIKKSSFWNTEMIQTEPKKWLKRDFAFILQSKETSPQNINATLRIKVAVGESNAQRSLENFAFSSMLRVNPTSRGLYNLDLLSTSLNQINNSAFIIKELILTAIKKFQSEEKEILTFFDNNSSLTKDDMKTKKDKSYSLGLTGLAFCYMSLKKSLEHLRYNISTISITENIATNLKPNTLRLLESNYYNLVEKIRDKYIMQSKSSEEIANRLQAIKLHKHSESDGSTLNNKHNRSAISFYIKNRKQYINKLARTTKDSFQNLVRAINSSRHIKFDDNIIRLEITIFDYSKIIQKHYFDLFEHLLLMINNMVQYYEEKELEEVTKHYDEFMQRFELQATAVFKNWIEIPSLEELENKKEIPYWLAVDLKGKG